MKTLPRGADCVPRFCPYLFFCVFYRLEVYSVAYMRLGDLLVSSGIITGEQLEQALALPREDGQRLGDVLIRQIGRAHV